MTLRILIADDDPLACQRLRQVLTREPGVQVAGVCGEGPRMMEAIRTLDPDLVFLDVNLPGGPGFRVREALGVDRPVVVFMTTLGAHSLPELEAQGVDYLLKPLEGHRIRRALDRACLRRGRRGAPELEPEVAADYAESLPVKVGSRQVWLRTSAIQWVESEDNYVRLHAPQGDYLMRQTMRGLLGQLDPRRFRRIHRTAIVNLDAVQELQPWTGGDHLVLMKDGTRLTLSRTYRDAFSSGS